MLTNQYIFQCAATGDPVRMGAQVVSGIGFLGAGTIIVTRRNQIKGLTTAAGLWASAGVGLALGIGFYEAAISGAVAVFFVITMLQKMDIRMHRQTRQVGVYFELTDKLLLGDFLRAVREMDIDVTDVVREHQDDSDKVRAYIATLRSKKRRNHEEIAELVRALEGVEYLEEL